jgi:hypothetical protein
VYFEGFLPTEEPKGIMSGCELPHFYMFPHSHGKKEILRNRKEAKIYKKRVVFIREGFCVFS